METINMDGFEAEERPLKQNSNSNIGPDHPGFTELWDKISQGLDEIWLQPYHHDFKLYMKIYGLRWDFVYARFL
jgi:hypothetical protein